MSRCETLGRYIRESDRPQTKTPSEGIGQIPGVPVGRLLPQYKKKLPEYGHRIGKISVKARTVLFARETADV